jgi:uncharacterized membrane protein
MATPDAYKSRLAYIDWMRGLACVLMFQTHCYDSWLAPAKRQTTFFMYSQLGGTFPAPLFLFLAGISFALVTEKLWQKGLPSAQVARTTILRGTEIFAFGLLFRLQEYAVAWGWAPKTDLLRVDILNTIGVSMMLMGVLCWIVGGIFLTSNENEGAPSLPRFLRQEPALSLPNGWETEKPAQQTNPTVVSNENGSSENGSNENATPAASSYRTVVVVAAALTALLISLLTPLLWTTWRPRWLPWPVESYIDGVHNLGVPQPGIFPIFPWTGFAFAGLAVGFIVHSEWAHAQGARIFLYVGVSGALLIVFSRWLDAQPGQLYPVYDYWLTSPSFFLIRVGMLLVILTAAYAWCRWVIGKWFAGKWSFAPWGFSPLIQLGQASLLVYWVHIEFVYGRVSILPKRAMGIGGASVGLLVISLAMLALAYVRTRTKGRGAAAWTWLHRTPART